jgi:hypothetical protein
LPSLLRAAEVPHNSSDGSAHPVQFYFEFLVSKGVTERTECQVGSSLCPISILRLLESVHNGLVALLAQQDDERPFLRYLGTPGESKLHCSLDLALHLVTKSNKVPIPLNGAGLPAV